MIRIIVLFYFSLCCTYLLSQQPEAYFAFDCNLIDETGNYNDFDTPFFPNCDCAVVEDGVLLNATNVLLTADTALSAVFNDDFAISLFFRSSATSGSQELLSLGDNCSSDSTFRLFYLPAMDEIVFEISESIQKSATLRANLPENKCWNQIIITRENNNYTLFINGEIADEINFPNQIFISENQPLNVGHGPCVGVISDLFSGVIDELQIFNENIQPFRARELYVLNDEIVNNDTTIFEGDVIDLQAIQTCNSIIDWMPSTGIADPTSFNTTVEGIQTTQYIAQFSGNSCVTLDTFNLFIVDPNEIQCEDLVLPNVFTPNGDGLNDSFGILNGFIIEELNYFQIFDRWGELVFNAQDKSTRWDGSFKGKAVNSSMLVYKISYRCNGNDLVKMGNVSILR